MPHLILEPSRPLLVGTGEIHATAVAFQALLVVVIVLVRVGRLCKQKKWGLHSFKGRVRIVVAIQAFPHANDLMHTAATQKPLVTPKTI